MSNSFPGCLAAGALSVGLLAQAHAYTQSLNTLAVESSLMLSGSFLHLTLIPLLEEESSDSSKDCTNVHAHQPNPACARSGRSKEGGHAAEQAQALADAEAAASVLSFNSFEHEQSSQNK